MGSLSLKTLSRTYKLTYVPLYYLFYSLKFIYFGPGIFPINRCTRKDYSSMRETTHHPWQWNVRKKITRYSWLKLSGFAVRTEVCYAHLAASSARYYIVGEYSKWDLPPSSSVRRRWGRIETKNLREYSITLKKWDSNANFALRSQKGRKLEMGHPCGILTLKPHECHMGECLNEEPSPLQSSNIEWRRKRRQAVPWRISTP